MQDRNGRRRRSMTAAGKVAALGVLDREWRELDALFRGLTPAELERPMYTEDGPGWRVRDPIPHLPTWHGRAAKAPRKGATEGVAPKPDERVRTLIGVTDTLGELKEG